MSNISPVALSEAQIAHFIAHGYVQLRDAFGPDLARQGRDLLWRAMGLSPDAPETWTKPVVRLPFMAGTPFVEAANTPALHAAYDALAGEGRWLRPNGLGSFPIRFPSPDDPGDAGWHIDASLGTDNPDFMEWRTNVFWPPGRQGRSICAIPSWSMRRSRTTAPGPASWPSRRCCRRASSTRRCRPRRCRPPSDGRSAWRPDARGSGADRPGPLRSRASARRPAHPPRSPSPCRARCPPARGRGPPASSGCRRAR